MRECLLFLHSSVTHQEMHLYGFGKNWETLLPMVLLFCEGFFPEILPLFQLTLKHWTLLKTNVKEMLCIANFKCTCNMVSIVLEVFLSDFCYLLSFIAFQVEEALYVFISVFLSLWYKILTMFPSKELFKNKAKLIQLFLKCLHTWSLIHLSQFSK